MSLFQPSNIIPDVRSGIGLGVADATQGLTVSWHINGASALQSYAITIYDNDAESTQLFTTGQITTGCPAYGTTSTGGLLFFSYTIPAASLSAAGITNGNEYKLIIQQWWSANDSVTQSSASVFVTRATPTLSVSAIGTSGVIGTRYYTFTGNYAQAQGDTLNWFRWQIAYADNTGNPFYDTGNISGTMDIAAYYDGFFTGADYAIRLTCQTENGVEADTGWVDFSCEYSAPDVPGDMTAGCVSGTDAVLVNWSGIGYIPGEASGGYQIQNDPLACVLESGTTIEWDRIGAAPMSFSAPWGVVGKWSIITGEYNDPTTTIFTIGQSDGDITLSYNAATASLILAKGGTTLVAQSGIINDPNLYVVLTSDALYLRTERSGGGLYPSETLYPSASLYPSADSETKDIVNTYTLSPSYTQGAITSVIITGQQTCFYLEVIDGTPSAATITAVITNGDYEPGLGEADYMLADWDGGIDAGTLNVGGQSLSGFALYRRQGNQSALVKIAETDNATDTVYDYGAVSQQGPYTYYLFPLGETSYIASPIISGATMPCWWNWTLMECAATADESIFTVLAAYRFRFGVETSPESNNNQPSLLHNFTQYPKVQLAPQNYKTGTLTGLIGAVKWDSGQPEYEDTIELKNAIYALSLTQNPLFLKNRKGELLRIRISGAISMQTGDATKEQTQTMTLPWAETGSAENVSLYSTAYVGVQEEEGQSKPQYFVDTSDATADDAEIRLDQTAYGAGGKIIGSAQFTADENTLVAPLN